MIGHSPGDWDSPQPLRLGRPWTELPVAPGDAHIIAVQVLDPQPSDLPTPQPRGRRKEFHSVVSMFPLQFYISAKESSGTIPLFRLDPEVVAAGQPVVASALPPCFAAPNHCQKFEMYFWPGCTVEPCFLQLIVWIQTLLIVAKSPGFDIRSAKESSSPLLSLCLNAVQPALDALLRKGKSELGVALRPGPCRGLRNPQDLRSQAEAPLNAPDHLGLELCRPRLFGLS